MAKVSGIGSSLAFAQYDLSGDIGALTSISASRTMLDVTSIQDPAPYRLPGRRDGAVGFLSYWNTTAGQAQAVLKAMPTSDVICTWFLSSTVGDPGASLVAKQTNYAPTLGADGSLTADLSAEANGYGLEWGQMLTTGKQTFASGTQTGTSVDLGSVSTLFGAAAYLHVFSIGSNSATVKLQDSADNGTFADLTGMTFTSVSAATSERIQGGASATVRRYVRLNVSGTYTNLVCAVNFVRYFASPNS